MWLLRISDKSLRHVEKTLVRAKISDRRLRNLAQPLSSLLEAIDKLDELNIDELEPAVVYVAGEEQYA